MDPKRLVIVGVSTCLLACQAVVPTATRKAASPVRKPSLAPVAELVASTPVLSESPTEPPAGSPRPSPAVGPGSAPTSPVVPGPTAPIGALGGVVRAPARLITNNGAGLISDRGGGLVSDRGSGLISDGGGAYRLRALESQVPVAGVIVRLRDAAGQPVRGTNGQPLQAVTDATGRYVFTEALPPRALIVSAELAAGKGAVEAVSVKAGTTREANLDLVSTLTTGYIVDRFVKGQTDPLATLEKLPADVEAETRAKTAAALERQGTAVPEALTTGAVVATLEAVRVKDAALSAQLDYVRSLLIVAGVSDLGSGRPATQVSIGYLTSVEAAPDGSLYLCSSYDNRVWRLRPDGILVTAAGGRKVTEQVPIQGLAGPEASLYNPAALAVDAQGRVLIMEYGRLSRLKLDGTLEVLVDGLSRGESALAGEGETVYYTLGYTWDATHDLYEWTPQGTRKLCSFQAATPFDRCGRSKEGKFYASANSRVLEVSPTTGATRVVPDAHAIDAAGHLFNITGDNLVQLLPDGTRKPLGSLTGSPSAVHVTVGPQGEGYVASFDEVHRVGLGRVAGNVSKEAGGNAADHSFTNPAGLVVGSGGQRYVSDPEAGQLLVIDAAQQIKALARTSQSDGFTVLRVGRQGELLGIQGTFVNETIQAIAADGTLSNRYTIPDSPHTWNLVDFVPAPDGALYVALQAWGDRQATELRRVAADGTERLVFETGYEQLALAPEANGGVLVIGEGLLRRVSPTGAVTELHADGRFGSLPRDVNGMGARSALVADAQGRLIGTTGDEVWRFDLATKAFTLLAGQGGRTFTGSGVDDSLTSPSSPAFDRDGSLLFIDRSSRQVRRIPPDKLQ